MLKKHGHFREKLSQDKSGGKQLFSLLHLHPCTVTSALLFPFPSLLEAAFHYLFFCSPLLLQLALSLIGCCSFPTLASSAASFTRLVQLCMLIHRHEVTDRLQVLKNLPFTEKKSQSDYFPQYLILLKVNF